MELRKQHLFGTGIVLQLRTHGRSFWLGSGHLPHQQRPDAEDVWLSSLTRLDEILSEARFCDVITIGIDCNQNLMHENPSFAALSRIHILLKYRGLEFNPAYGPTWTARGEASTLDWLLFRWPMTETTFFLRQDLRLALPSDHNPLFGVFTGRLGLQSRPPRPKHFCGRWQTSSTALEAFAANPALPFTQEAFQQLCQSCSSRMPSWKYRDPKEVKDLIRQRKICSDPTDRLELAKQVQEARTQAQKQHKLHVLQRARDGDRSAISHLRRSASQSFSDGSLIERMGGQAAATSSMKSFYQRKYTLPDSDRRVSVAQLQALQDKHASATVAPVTQEEVGIALSKVRPQTASGNDAVTWEALRTYHASDRSHKLAGYFTNILSGEQSVPKSWREGKICFLPKKSRPDKPQDLRPISLTPCLCKLFSKILLARLQGCFPPYGAGQHACRKGCQSIEAVACAQGAMKIYKGATGQDLLMMKLDLAQAFDTLSHQAVWRFLLQTRASREALLLWELTQQTKVSLQLGADHWGQDLQRGLLQGTAFSADLFARVIDHFLQGLLPQWDASCSEIFRRFELPHCLLFADDLLIMASSTVELQRKLRDLQDTLKAIGLLINTRKCSVLKQPDGNTPAVWPRGAATPLQGESELMYLGVPLAHKTTPLGQMGASLAKVSASFFGLRKLFDHPDTPVSEKLDLFRSYITSKWAWASPTSWPSRQALKSLEAFKHTLLLSLLRLEVDPLVPLLRNIISRRRAVQAVCSAHNSEPWGQVWLTRLWNFWGGHALRSRSGLPLQKLLVACSSFTVGRKRVPKQSVQEFLPRKLQLKWCKFKASSPYPWVEALAQDREGWNLQLKPWLKQWGYGAGPKLRSPNFLLDRQLLMVGKQLAVLRPARVFPDEPYHQEVQHIQPLEPSARKWLIWCFLTKSSCRLYIRPPSQVGRQKSMWMQGVPTGTPDLLATRLLLWHMLLQVLHMVPQLRDTDCQIMLPLHAFGAHIYAHKVPLSSLSDVQRLERQEIAINLLQYCHLQPATLPCWLRLALDTPPVHIPAPYRFLVRDHDFSNAQFLMRLDCISTHGTS